MPTRIAFFVLSTAICVLSPRAQGPVSHHLVHVTVGGQQQMATLLQLDLDVAGSRAIRGQQHVVDVIVTDADVAQLRASGLPFRVEIRNLEQHHARRLAAFGPFEDTLTPELGQGSMGGHYTLGEMEAILDSFHQAHPGLCSAKTSIGQTIEGRDIWMVKISDNVGVNENEPEALYTGLHHAREPLSMSTALLFMDELLEGYGTDPEATFIIDNRELFFVPCVNPDGYEYNYQQNPGGGGMWRKNRRNNQDGTFGVDLNRNYSEGWTAPNGGNSTSTSSTTYRGAAPNSEPETVTLTTFANSRDFIQVMDTHTYTDVVLRPWFYQNGQPANAALYDLVGGVMTAQNGVAHGAGAAQLYIAAGTSPDWHHVQRGSLAWLPELGKSSEGGFWPDPVQTVVIARRYQSTYRAMATTSGSYLKIEQITVTEMAGGNGNGIVEPGESGEVVVRILNEGLAAMSSTIDVVLAAQPAGIAIGSGAANLTAPGSFATVDNASAPLTFTVPSGFTGKLYFLEIAAVGNDQLLQQTVPMGLVPPRVVVDDDMELDRGFERGPSTATTGLWERGTPQQTTSGGAIIQPGTQHTPGGSLCWVTDPNPGSSAGNFDVDGGYTDLLSPVLDLAHLGLVELSIWRWYGERTNDDPFEIFVSYDGGQSWDNLLSSPASTTAWTEFRAELPRAPTSTMQFRFRAQDLNPSLVEAALDDFSVLGLAEDGAVTLLSSGAVGTEFRVGVNAPQGSLAYVLASPSTTSTPMTWPGVGGALRIGMNGLVVVPPVTVGASGHAGRDLHIPNVPSLAGLTFHWQCAWFDGSQFAFGENVQSVTLR